MDIEQIKEEFHKRSPKCLPENFLIDKNKIVNLLNAIHSDGNKNQVNEQPEHNYIREHSKILYDLLSSRKKDVKIVQKKVMEDMVKIIREWNTLYHPTEGDYRNLTNQILNYLKKENII